MIHAHQVHIAAALLTFAGTIGAQQAPSSSSAAPQFPAAEAKAYELKAQGRYAQSRDAFLDLLQDKAGDARAAALAEYFAVMAHEMTSHLGAWEQTEKALEQAQQGSLAAHHPALRDRLAMLCLRIDMARGDLARANAATQSQGFLTRWWLIGPFDNERGGGFQKAYGPEHAIDLQAHYDGKKRPVAWRQLPAATIPGGRVNLDAMVRPNEQVLCYAATALQSDQDRAVVLHLGSDEAFKVFLDGHEVAARDLRRRFAYDQDAIVLHLRAGPNLLLLKVCDQEGAFEFAARLTEMDGSPLRGVASTAAATDIAAAAQRKDDRPATRAEGSDQEPSLGARSVFAASVAKSHDPLDAFRLAYILTLIQPDDPNARRDHELAKQAVAAMPDDAAARYLLAYTRLRPFSHDAEKEENARRHDYLDILAAHPDQAQSLMALARMDLENTGAATRAEERLRKALAVNTDYLEARMSLGEALERLQLDALASDELNRAGRRTAEGWFLPQARARLAEELEKQGQLAAAAECRSDVYAATHDAANLRALAHVWLRQGRRDDTLKLLELAEEMMPFELAPRELAARLFEAEQDFPKAMAALRRWLVVCPEDDQVIVELARLQGLAGNLEQQRELLRTAVDLNPNLKDERRHLEFLEAEEKPFYDSYALDSAAILARDPGPPADAATANDPFYYVVDQRIVRAYRNGTTSSYRNFIVRILTEEGARQMARHYVQHYYGEQRARLLQATIVKKSGQVLRPQLHGYYVDLPALAPGDSVEIRSRVDDLGPTFFGDYFGYEHYFTAGEGVPCRDSQLVLLLDPGRAYQFQAKNGAPEGTEGKDGQLLVRRFEMKDLGRRDLEIRMPERLENEPLVRVTTYGTWDQFSAWWWNLIRNQIEVSPAMKSKVQELTAGLAGEMDRIAAIYKFVTTEVRYTAWEFGVHGYKPYSTPVIFERRHGDCKDKALLLNALLSEIGVKAFPVLINAESLRSADDLSLPLVGNFNHCISYLPAEGDRPEMFLDGTATYHPIDTLPSMDRGAKVLVVHGAHGELHDIPWTDPLRNRDQRSFDVVLTESGDAAVKMVRTPLQNEAVGLREDLANEPARQREKLESELSKSFGKVAVKDIQSSDALDIGKPLQLSVKFDVSQFAAREGDRLILKANPEPQNLQQLTRHETRKFALLLGPPQSQHLELRYELPPGYEPLNLPSPIEIKNNFGSFRMSFSFESGAVRVLRDQVLAAHRIEPPEYGEFRDFAAVVDQADNQVLVVKRKGGQR